MLKKKHWRSSMCYKKISSLINCFIKRAILDSVKCMQDSTLFVFPWSTHISHEPSDVSILGRYQHRAIVYLPSLIVPVEVACTTWYGSAPKAFRLPYLLLWLDPWLLEIQAIQHCSAHLSISHTYVWNKPVLDWTILPYYNLYHTLWGNHCSALSQVWSFYQHYFIMCMNSCSGLKALWMPTHLHSI